MSMSMTIWSLLKEHGSTILGFLPRMIKKVFTRKYDRIFEINAVLWYRTVIQPSIWKLESILDYASARDYGYSGWDRRCSRIPSLLQDSEDPDTLRHFLMRNPAVSRQIELVRSGAAELSASLIEASEGMKSWGHFQGFVTRSVTAYNASQAGRKARNWAGPDLDPGQLEGELTRILLHDPDVIRLGGVYDDFHSLHASAYKAFLGYPWLHDRIKRIDLARMKIIQYGRPLLEELQKLGDRVRDNHRIDVPSREKAEHENLEWEGSDTLF